VHHVRQHRIEWAVHLLRRHGGPAARRLLLDVGCGPGESAFQTALALGGFARVVGIDLGRDFGALFAAFARANGVAARYARASCLDLPVRRGSVDVLVSFEMLEHVPDWGRFLDEAAAALAPGGMLLASTPNPLAVHSLLKWPYQRVRGFAALNRAYRRAGDFYERFLPVRALVERTRGAGLDVLEAAFGGHTFTFTPDGLLPANRAVEGFLERHELLARVAVTTFLLARKPA